MENSCRKYQVCKPVAPQQRKTKQRKILIFNENRDFLFSPKTQKDIIDIFGWQNPCNLIIFRDLHKLDENRFI